MVSDIMVDSRDAGGVDKVFFAAPSAKRVCFRVYPPIFVGYG